MEVIQDDVITGQMLDMSLGKPEIQQLNNVPECRLYNTNYIVVSSK